MALEVNLVATLCGGSVWGILGCWCFYFLIWCGLHGCVPFGNATELTHLPCDYVWISGLFQKSKGFRPLRTEPASLSEHSSTHPLGGTCESTKTQVTCSQTHSAHHPLVIPDSLEHLAALGLFSPFPTSGLRLVFYPIQQNCWRNNVTRHMPTLYWSLGVSSPSQELWGVGRDTGDSSRQCEVSILWFALPGHLPTDGVWDTGLLIEFCEFSPRRFDCKKKTDSGCILEWKFIGETR